jgi:hypothetical protein
LLWRKIELKPLSRKPFVLMLKDDSGELAHVKLDPGLVNSQNAIIVLDEINDTCWVWIGRDVNMPTRMHALRMSKSVQKSGYSVGATTIGMSIDRMVEMMEKDDSDPDVATSIAGFRDLVARKWSFDDGVLAFDPSQAKAYEARPPDIVEASAASSAHVSHAAPKVETGTIATAPRKGPTTVELVAETVESEEPEKKPAQLTVTSPGLTAEKKAAFLLYSAIKGADIVYVEKFERNGVNGIRVEAPGVMVVEALLKGNDITITPAEFGETEQAEEIKKTYESWIKRI